MGPFGGVFLYGFGYGLILSLHGLLSGLPCIGEGRLVLNFVSLVVLVLSREDLNASSSLSACKFALSILSLSLSGLFFLLCLNC